MLSAQETDQLVLDIQQAFPTLTVDQRQYLSSQEYVVIVCDPTNGNEVRVTSLKGDWRSKVATMAAHHTPPEAEADR